MKNKSLFERVERTNKRQLFVVIIATVIASSIFVFFKFYEVNGEPYFGIQAFIIVGLMWLLSIVGFSAQYRNCPICEESFGPNLWINFCGNCGTKLRDIELQYEKEKDIDKANKFRTEMKLRLKRNKIGTFIFKTVFLGMLVIFAVNMKSREWMSAIGSVWSIFFLSFYIIGVLNMRCPRCKSPQNSKRNYCTKCGLKYHEE